MKRVSWVLDADIEAFFDTIDQRHLQAFIEHRIGDTRMVRLLMKWAKAGVMEEGKLHETQEGTPQGGIISPLLANLYLHYVLDLWVPAAKAIPAPSPDLTEETTGEIGAGNPLAGFCPGGGSKGPSLPEQP